MKESIVSRLQFPVLFIVSIWGVHIVKEVTDLPLASFGVLPRDTDGLIGIVASPLIHGSIGHLISNTIPALILMSIIFLFYRTVALRSFVLIYILTGITVWFIGKNAYHIGASGVVYGLVTFVFWSGIFRRNVKSIVLALVVLVMYSGYFFGIVPNQPGISWESHLGGALVGIVVAYIFKDGIEEEEIEDEEPEEDREYFLDRDVFS